MSHSSGGMGTPNHHIRYAEDTGSAFRLNSQTSDQQPGALHHSLLGILQ